MRWLLALPLVPLLLCGVFCLGGLVVAFVLGRASAGTSDRDPRALFSSLAIVRP